MGETTGISWCDATWNPWIGCTKVSAGCRLCYAEVQNRRYHWNPDGWGKGTPRKKTSVENWKKPLAWARKAVEEGVLRRVFAGSLCDPLDPEVPQIWRDQYFNVIDEAGEYCRYHRSAPGAGLEFMILTKRIERAWKMLPGEWLEYPPEYVRLGTTVEDQPNGDIRLGELLGTWAGKNFVSAEPLLGPLDLTHDLDGFNPSGRSVQWLVVGGESGAGCRPMDLSWARSLLDQCRGAGVPFFFKQIGGYPDKRHRPEQWPEDLRVQEFPEDSPDETTYP